MTRHCSSVFSVLMFATLPMLAQLPQPDWDKVQVKLQKLDDHVYLVQGFGGNIGAYVGDDGVVLIDTEQVQLGPKIEAAMKTVSSARVKYVLNTHWHGDHTGGNAYFGKSAIIIAQDDVRRTMQTGTDHLGRITNLPVSVPVLTFSDQFTLHLLNHDLANVNGASVNGGAAPPFTSIFLSLRSAANPMKLLSGDQDG